MVMLTGRQKSLLTNTALLVGGSICGGPLGTISTSIAGGIVATDLVNSYLNNIGVRLRHSGDQLGTGLTH